MENRVSEPEQTRGCKGKTLLSLSLKKSRARSSGDAAAPSAKRPRQALQPTNDRFNAVFESKCSEMAVPFVPSNTKKYDDWAYNNFIAWCDAHNHEHPENPCPEDLYKQLFDVSALTHIGCPAMRVKLTRVGESNQLLLFIAFLVVYCVVCELCPQMVDKIAPTF